MKDQNIGLGENSMSCINFPCDFPSIEAMLSILKKEFEKSWKVDLNIEDVNHWLNNFTGRFFDIEGERRLALWLLCNFTYYNDNEINQLCSVLYKNFVHTLMEDYHLTSSEEVENHIHKLKFTSIGRPSESGGLILYHFRQEAQLSTDCFIFPTSIEAAGASTIVCIDDVMISGGTAQRFFHQNKTYFQEKSIYYLTLLSSKEALSKLNNLNIKVISCAVLDERNQAFSEESLCFFKYLSLKEPAKKLAEGYGKIIEPKKPLGHNGGQYCFGFSYNIPNNSLPIFWSSSNGWSPIFHRKEKFQNAKQISREYDFFI